MEAAMTVLVSDCLTFNYRRGWVAKDETSVPWLTMPVAETLHLPSTTVEVKKKSIWERDVKT